MVKQKQPQKDHPKLLNPANTTKIVASKKNEIKEIIEEAIEESIEQSQLKKNNLKIIIPDNSNDDMEPSTSGSKLSQNTPSSSPLIIDKNIKKVEDKNFISLNKNDKNIIKDEELFKVTPHFLNDNKTSCESLKEDSILKRPIVPVNENKNKIKSPLTCEYKCISNYKFNFNFETKENGVIIPKEKSIKEEKKVRKIANAFRIGNKISNKNKKFNEKNSSNNKIYAKNESQSKKCNKINHSPLNSSLISLKYKVNQTSPINTRKNKENNYNTNKEIQKKLINDNSLNNIRNNKEKYIIIENQKKLRTPRPNSVKNISSPKKIYKTNKINDINKEKQVIINDNTQKKYYSNSVNKNKVLPKLENKISNIKNQLETECTNLIKILPDNYEEYPEIKNNLGLIFQKIYGIKDYINKNTQYSFRPNNKKFSENIKK